MFDKILIANRGEIAVRIIQACQHLGITTVALVTDADASWQARELADETVHIGSGPVFGSYLDFDKVIAAARRSGAQAIHPGYGLLAENSAFARRCQQEGVCFIGPSPEVIELMGNKANAKQLVADLGIATIPGRHDNGASDIDLLAAAVEMGYPVMLKAVAGGGGIGMRVIEREDEFIDALHAVRREAKSSFADERLLLEKYFRSVRHIEVQVVADNAGNAIHCYERECSIQRHRQKIIEEAPSAFISPALREAICAAALRITTAVDYSGVGTVEFIVSQTDTGEEAFYFLEMNTRLQVEHGVTETVTGLDLVQMQIDIAAGRTLTLNQDDVQLNGYAIECRVCAEQPEKGFLPMTGNLALWSVPQGDYLRIDSGVRTGTTISAFYDSLLAKFISSGVDRQQALRRMRYCLEQAIVLGVTTNLHFLSRILTDDDFAAGHIDTEYVDRNEAQLLTLEKDQELVGTLGAIGAIALTQFKMGTLVPSCYGPFHRNYHFCLDGVVVNVDLHYLEPDCFRLFVGGREYVVGVTDAHNGLRLNINGHEKVYAVNTDSTSIDIHVPGAGNFKLMHAAATAQDTLEQDKHDYTAGMAGQVVAVFAQQGAPVKAGDELLVLESMKMEHSITARSAGVIKQLFVEQGVIVAEGDQLLALEDG